MPRGRSIPSSTSDTLRVCETFVSLSGETTRQGLPAWFVRLTGCNLRCAWCDTAYAWKEGSDRTIDSLVAEAASAAIDLAIVTGGEPLLQPGVNKLIAELLALNHTVLVETNGTMPIAGLPKGAVRIIDVKPPSAKANEPFLLENLRNLRPSDELKFVVADLEDFLHAEHFVSANGLKEHPHLLVMPVWGNLDDAKLAQWILDSPIRFRQQCQLHKILWGEKTRGR